MLPSKLAIYCGDLSRLVAGCFLCRGNEEPRRCKLKESDVVYATDIASKKNINTRYKQKSKWPCLECTHLGSFKMQKRKRDGENSWKLEGTESSETSEGLTSECIRSLLSMDRAARSSEFLAVCPKKLNDVCLQQCPRRIFSFFYLILNVLCIRN